MAAAVAKTKVTDEVQITHVDQQMINSFANKNAKQNELKTIIENKKKELQNLEDAGDELILLDDEGTIPVHVGETFMHLSMEQAQEFIDSKKETIENDVRELDTQMQQYKGELKDLKVKLYAKFGTNINLEEDEDS
ncbi:prefoldin subunit 4-like [Hydractinia symbiolongicarpus]|uniref:prefoldin subunit 4-like n=1 Tax=Hydractinia symbiolongicarpus TaxID=13093 RepID=UPI00255184B0|nr:prefoldin subunit 4-like [Hydractinia symbiolongicarpus]